LRPDPHRKTFTKPALRDAQRCCAAALQSCRSWIAQQSDPREVGSADKPDLCRHSAVRCAGQSVDSSDAPRRSAYSRQRPFVPARMAPIVTGGSPHAC
jgi:hypothetical protein